MGEPESDWGFPNPATPPGSSAYYSLRLAPAGQRDDLAALLGWRRQVRSVLERTADPRLSSAKLQWWRDELDRLYAGHPTHPLTRRLAAPIAQRTLPREPFAEMVRAAQAQLDGRCPDRFEGIVHNAEGDFGSLFELVLRTADDPSPDKIARARRLGAWAGLVYGIRDSGLSIRRGRLGFVSADILAELGLDAGDLALPAGPARLPRVLARLAERSRALGDPQRDRADLPLPLRIRVELLERLLREIERSGFDLADRRLDLTPIRKLWHAWRESRR